MFFYKEKSDGSLPMGLEGIQNVRLKDLLTDYFSLSGSDRTVSIRIRYVPSDFDDPDKIFTIIGIQHNEDEPMSSNICCLAGNPPNEDQTVIGIPFDHLANEEIIEEVEIYLQPEASTALQ